MVSYVILIYTNFKNFERSKEMNKVKLKDFLKLCEDLNEETLEKEMALELLNNDRIMITGFPVYFVKSSKYVYFEWIYIL